MTADPPPAADLPPAADRRLLLVHAHPDDETVGTGLTMARYAAEGAAVVLVTCTLGEEGEVRVPALAGLAAGRADQLGGYRIGELAQACAALGVADHRFLGGPGRFRDSGMMGLPTNDHPRAFWSADLDEAALLLVEVLREVRPQVVLTYDPNGFYGHPDHVQAHRVTMRAVDLAADPAVPGPPWQVSKVYWTAVARSALAAGLEAFAGAADNPFAGVGSVEELPFGTPDADVTAAVVAPERLTAKQAALRAHASQIAPDDWLHTLASVEGGAVEPFVLAVGARGPAGPGPHGWEDDLFAGV